MPFIGLAFSSNRPRANKTPRKAFPCNLPLAKRTSGFHFAGIYDNIDYFYAMQNQHELISVVIATYNRSNVLRYAIETVIMQTYQNWELIVVGDCCTDDTKEVVESFAHESIRFINLEKNVGEQSGPNNYGMSVANGKYIAFLNHDDLWFSNHLERLYEKKKAGNFDLVYSLYFAVPFDNNMTYVSLRAKNENIHSYPSPASTWLFDTQLYKDIGPWEFYKKLKNVPSQAWLLKVSKTKKIGLVNEVTVIAIQSGNRGNSYKNRDFKENEFYFNAIQQHPDKLLKEIYFSQFVLLKDRYSKPFYNFKAILRNIIVHILTLIGITHGEILFFLKHPKKGSFINQLRKVRGLPKI